MVNSSIISFLEIQYEYISLFVNVEFFYEIIVQTSYYVFQNLSTRKPCCTSASGLNLSKYFPYGKLDDMLGELTASTSETDWQFAESSLEAFLKIVVTCACLCTSGNCSFKKNQWLYCVHCKRFQYHNVVWSCSLPNLNPTKQVEHCLLST